MNGKYRITIDFEYKNQNKRGGRPTIIKIPKGTIGEKRGGELIFYTLSRKGHNPFVFWVDAYLHVEKVET